MRPVRAAPAKPFGQLSPSGDARAPINGSAFNEKVRSKEEKKFHPVWGIIAGECQSLMTESATGLGWEMTGKELEVQWTQGLVQGTVGRLVLSVAKIRDGARWKSAILKTNKSVFSCGFYATQSTLQDLVTRKIYSEPNSPPNEVN